MARRANGIAGEPLRNVTLLAVHPADPDVLFATKQLHQYAAEVYRSRDGGAHWTRVDLPSPLLPRSIRFDPADPSIIYIASACQLYFLRNGPRADYHEAAGVFRSTDGGVTWKPMKTAGACIEALSLDPLMPSHIYVRRDYGAFEESFDRGETWRVIPYGEGQVVPGDDVVVDPRDGMTRYGIVDQPARFVVSTDGGITWTTRTPAGVTGWRYESLTIDPGTGRLFLGTDEGLFRSGDGGQTWIHITSVPGTIITGTVVDPATRSVVAATAFGLYALDFPYATATPASARDRGTNVFRVMRDPKDGQRLFASTVDDSSSGAGAEGRLFRSRDGAATWEQVPLDSLQARFNIAVDGGGTLYAANRGKTLYRLRRDANQLEALPRDFVSIHDVFADPVRVDTVYVVALFGSYVSRDAGETWEQWAFPSTSVVDVAVTNPNVIAGTTFDALIWTSDGLNWNRTAIAGQRPESIAIAPSDPATIYFVTEGGREGRPAHTIARSRNGGKSWSRMTAPDTGSDTVRITALAVDPQDANKVWAATNAGLFVSTDAAISWTYANAGLPTRDIRSIAIDLQRGTMHVATEQGVWSRRPAGRRRAVR